MSSIVDALPIRDISVSQMQEITATYLDGLNEMLRVTRADATVEETPYVVIVPYHIFQNIQKAIADAEKLSLTIMQQASVKKLLL